MTGGGRFDVLAHRGGRGTHPENTMAAFEHAARCGADGIEFDVHLSRDGIPVVIHDAVLDRTTDGRGAVAEHTAAELARLDAGSWFDPRFRGERIPLLTELLDWAATNDLQLQLELKDGPAADDRLARTVTDALRAAPTILPRTLVASFNHDSLVEAKRFLPELRTAVLYLFGLHRPWDYARATGATAVWCRWDAVTPDLVQQARDNDVDVLAFDVIDEATVRAVAATGCRGLFTPDPELALSVRRSLAGRDASTD